MPFYNLEQKNTIYKCTIGCQRVFLKKLTSATILAYPRFNKPFVLDTNASDIGIVPVLSQVQDAKERVFAFATKSFSKSQHNCSITSRSEPWRKLGTGQHTKREEYTAKLLVYWWALMKLVRSPAIGLVISWLKQGARSSKSDISGAGPVLDRLWSQYERLQLVDGFLYH